MADGVKRLRKIEGNDMYVRVNSEYTGDLPQLLSRYCTTSSLRTLLRFFQDTHNTFTVTPVLLFNDLIHSSVYLITSSSCL